MIVYQKPSRISKDQPNNHRKLTEINQVIPELGKCGIEEFRNGAKNYENPWL